MSTTQSIRTMAAVHGGEVPFVASDELMATTLALPTAEKLSGALQLMGCEFWDEDGRYLKTPAVSLCGLGGMPVAQAGETPEVVGQRIDDFAAASRTTMELSGWFSYLNSGNMQPGQLYEKVTDLGHLSIAHTVTANILVAGITTGVECEFDTQRDLVHLSRVTVARTGVQVAPPIVAPDEKTLAVARIIVEASDKAIATVRSEKSDRDEHEILNRLYPSAKATAVMLSGSLRNLGKLVGQRSDPGKESEYRNVLNGLNGMLGTIWPEIFTNK